MKVEYSHPMYILISLWEKNGRNTCSLKVIKVLLSMQTDRSMLIYFSDNLMMIVVDISFLDCHRNYASHELYVYFFAMTHTDTLICVEG